MKNCSLTAKFFMLIHTTPNFSQYPNSGFLRVARVTVVADKFKGRAPCQVLNMSLSTYILHAMCVVFSNFRNRPRISYESQNHKRLWDRLTLSGLPRLRVQGSWLTVCAFRVGSLVEEAKEGRPAH